ncbi:MAG: YtxH domain-containing protein [Ferruginibacter sp.]
MSKKTLIFGILAAAAVGALAGILLAPDKGSKTRKKILKKSKEKADGLKNSLSDFTDSIANKFSKAADDASQKFNKAKSTAEQGT